MKLPFLFFTLLVTVAILGEATPAQSRKPLGLFKQAKPASSKSAEIGQSAIVVDETLSVLRKDPSLFAEAVHRMQRGRKVQILGIAEADGVRFYKVSAPPANFGWVQSDAVFGKFRAGDEERLAHLAQAADGFDQIEIATQFFGLFPDSKLKPALLLLFGDLLEEAAVRMSRDATTKLSRKEMAASAAPVHSYYLNFVSLDRYRKIGVMFVLNSALRQFHYDGASWKEIVAKFPSSPQATEARARLDALRQKMEQK